MSPPWLNFLCQPLGVTLAGPAWGRELGPGNPFLHLHYLLQGPGFSHSQLRMLCFVKDSELASQTWVQVPTPSLYILSLNPRLLSKMECHEVPSIKCLPGPSKNAHSGTLTPFPPARPAPAPAILLLGPLPVLRATDVS